jgi:cell division protein FtsW
MRIAKEAPDDFGKLLAVGITSWIGFQALVNLSAMVALVPLTGVPLPFISYGGSSLVLSLTAMGILVNISKNRVVKK